MDTQEGGESGTGRSLKWIGGLAFAAVIAFLAGHAMADSPAPILAVMALANLVQGLGAPTVGQAVLRTSLCGLATSVAFVIGSSAADPHRYEESGAYPLIPTLILAASAAAFGMIVFGVKALARRRTTSQK